MGTRWGDVTGAGRAVSCPRGVSGGAGTCSSPSPHLPQNSPNNISGISNPPGTPRDDGELGGNFLHSFQNDNVSECLSGDGGTVPGVSRLGAGCSRRWVALGLGCAESELLQGRKRGRKK